ncbi:hypothetical protein EDC01DRAFT_631379 [Geopyxis carbonaria]|nr:hypothetical protein EDC01DRAFT_631379 [Geopyxis carbonaria]
MLPTRFYAGTSPDPVHIRTPARSPAMRDSTMPMPSASEYRNMQELSRSITQQKDEITLAVAKILAGRCPATVAAATKILAAAARPPAASAPIIAANLTSSSSTVNTVNTVNTANIPNPATPTNPFNPANTATNTANMAAAAAAMPPPPPRIFSRVPAAAIPHRSTRVPAWTREAAEKAAEKAAENAAAERAAAEEREKEHERKLKIAREQAEKGRREKRR